MVNVKDDDTVREPRKGGATRTEEQPETQKYAQGIPLAPKASAKTHPMPQQPRTMKLAAVKVPRREQDEPSSVEIKIDVEDHDRTLAMEDGGRLIGDGPGGREITQRIETNAPPMDVDTSGPITQRDPLLAAAAAQPMGAPFPAPTGPGLAGRSPSSPELSYAQPPHGLAPHPRAGHAPAHAPPHARPMVPNAAPSDRVALPSGPAPAASARGATRPLPGWVLPYLVGCIALALVGMLVLFGESRLLGHF